MLDRSAAHLPRPTLGAADRRPVAGQRHGRALATCALLALALHLVFLDGVEGWLVPPSKPSAPSAPSVSLRTIVAEPKHAVAIEPAAAPATVPVPVDAPVPPAVTRQMRKPREAAVAPSASSPPVPEASAGSTATALPSSPATELAATPPAGASADAGAEASPVAGAGDRPPPLYQPRLPPPATLRYQVRRGGLRGQGEVRWQPAGDVYKLAFEARVDGLTLLLQTSEGGIDANGLAPVRFVDRRARRSAQAANFAHDARRVTFSGSSAAWPLFLGSQDRLSWMIQLAGIVAAEPQLLADGGRVAMAVVGARGDASVWTFRYVGWGQVDTAHGSVRAVKLVRDGRSTYDTTAEIWLDPDRSYLPVRATLRNNAGASEYDLLLDRVEP